MRLPGPPQTGRSRAERRLGSLGIARQRTTKVPVEGNDVGDAGEPAVVEGIRGRWRVDPARNVLVFAQDSAQSSEGPVQRDRDREARRGPSIEREVIDTSFRMERGGLVDLELHSGQITVTSFPIAENIW